MAERNLARVDLVKKTNLSYMTIHRILNDEVEPRDDTLERIATALEVPIEKLTSSPDIAKEDGPVWTIKGANAEGEITVRQAIRKLAREFECDEETLLKCLGKCVEEAMREARK